MKIRSEIIQDMYDMMNNEELCKDLQDAFEKSAEMCERNFPADKNDDFMEALCCLGHAAFFAGANRVLDFISGREVA